VGGTPDWSSIIKHLDQQERDQLRVILKKLQAAADLSLRPTTPLR
jgi:hypothetical protein